MVEARAKIVLSTRGLFLVQKKRVFKRSVALWWEISLRRMKKSFYMYKPLRWKEVEIFVLLMTLIKASYPYMPLKLHLRVIDDHIIQK